MTTFYHTTNDRERRKKNRNRNKFLKNKRVQVIWGKLDSQHSPEQIESSLNSNAFKGRANQNCSLSLKNHPLASWVSMGVIGESTDENKDIYWKLLNRGVRTFLFTLSPSLLASFSPSHLSLSHLKKMNGNCPVTTKLTSVPTAWFSK